MLGVGSNSKPYLLLVSIELDTFSILPPYVIGSRGIPLPMPTTLVGALMYPVLTRKYGPIELDPKTIYKEAYNIGILYASFRPGPYAVVTTMERVIELPYQKSYRAEKIKYLPDCLEVLVVSINYGIKVPWGAGSQEKESIKKDIEELLGHEVKKKCIDFLEAYNYLYGVSSRSLTVFGDTSYIAYIVRDPSIARHAWEVVRVGRKEDLGVVRDVKVIPLNELGMVIHTNNILTRFYAPASLVSNAKMNTIPYKMQVYVNGEFGEEPVYVPPSFTPDYWELRMELTPDWNSAVVYEVKTNDFVDYLLVPRKVVEL
mgnify:FL=1